MNKDYWEGKNTAQDEVRRLHAALKDIKELLFECAARDGEDIRIAYQIANEAIK